MSKTPLVIILLVVLSLFATADYYLNNLDQQVSLALETISEESGSRAETAVPTAMIDSIFRLGDSLDGYTVVSQVQTGQIFEKIDISSLTSLKAYRHEFRKPAQAEPETIAEEVAPLIEDEEIELESPDEEETSEPIAEEAMVKEAPLQSEPIYIYEIKGAKDQGSFTYLNVKLQFISQINATTETINEDSQFGQNSFFFNDLNYKNAAFLITQIGDTVFGFQYSKSSEGAYESIQSIIQSIFQQL